MTHRRLKEILARLVLVFACLTITTADQVGNPKVISACGHLSTQGDQYNFFEGAYGQKCCMCWKGNYLADECSVHDPNSTRCDPCEYDSNKQTFVDFEPHMERECKLDLTSCRPNMDYVPGSRSSQASCVCPTGTIEVIEHVQICHPLSNTSSTAKDDNFSTISDNMVSQAILNSGTTLSEESTQVPLDIARTTVQSINIKFEDISTIVSAGTNVTGSSTTLNNATTGAEGRSDIKFIIIIIILVACVVTLLVFLVGWRCGLFGGAPCTRIHKEQVEDEENKRSFLNISSESDSSKSGDHLLDEPKHVSIEMENKENVQTDNRARLSGTRNLEPCVRWQAVPLDEPYPPNEKPTSDSTPRNDDADMVDGIGASRNRDPYALSKQEKDLRYQTFMEMAKVIEKDDLCTVGRNLLSTGVKEFDDIFYDNIHGRAEKARQIFFRAAELNPGLSLRDIHNAVGDLGYLLQIADAKMALLRTDGCVD